jgi:hypothetical protein
MRADRLAAADAAKLIATELNGPEGLKALGVPAHLGRHLDGRVVLVSPYTIACVGALQGQTYTRLIVRICGGLPLGKRAADRARAYIAEAVADFSPLTFEIK